MRVMNRRVQIILLAISLMFLFGASAFAATEAPTSDRVVSIKAFTDMSVYGQKLSKVEIVYSSDTDLSGVAVANYTLWDRGSANPSFYEAKITAAAVSGSKVTLSITQDTEKTSDRSRNAVGSVTTTGAWYIGKDDKIYFGEGGGDTDPVTGVPFSANSSGMGYFTRENLDLVLCHEGDTIADGLKLTDGVGNYTAADGWLRTEALNGEPFEWVNLSVNAVVSRNTGEAFTAQKYDEFGGSVPVAVALPDGYSASRKYPLVLYVCGNGTSYWEEHDESGAVIANNLGTNVYYDNVLFSWLDKDVIVASPHVHSSLTQANTITAHEVAAVVELLTEKYSVDADRVILIGNSNGSSILSEVLRQYPKLASVYFQLNGGFGKNPGPGWGIGVDEWTSEEIQAIVEHGPSIWFHQGETDPMSIPIYNQNQYEKLLGFYRDAGYSEDWIAKNLRISAYMSWRFKEWGEIDHSCTRILWWYYPDTAYRDVYASGSYLPVGSTYKLTGNENFDYGGAEDFEYTVYGDSVQAWGLSAERNEAPGSSESSGSSGCSTGVPFALLLLLCPFTRSSLTMGKGHRATHR